jgi:hypothetical protein
MDNRSVYLGLTLRSKEVQHYEVQTCEPHKGWYTRITCADLATIIRRYEEMVCDIKTGQLSYISKVRLILPLMTFDSQKE